MEVILLEKIINLGMLGHKVKVKPGYARNYLIPQGKALPATRENLAIFESRRLELEKTQGEKLTYAQTRAAKLKDLVVIIAGKVGMEGKLFGSVNAADIAKAVTTASGVEVMKQEVQLPYGPLRLVGEYNITLHFHPDVEAIVKIQVIPEA